ncbi:MAG TPA: SDR family oxidoreductase [Steroidobacteraceae bacterium]|nr:SDR family oxidoreductase [Steroidobacteraceae bacterium]
MSAGEPRVCLLTGASGQLGAAFSRLYGHRYHIVAVCRTRVAAPPPPMCWSFDPLDPLHLRPARECRFATIRADLGMPNESSRVVDFALDTFGRVDVLVNAAAYVRWANLLSGDLSIRDVTRMLEMNAVVPLHLALELARRYWASRGAENATRNRNVVNVSSIAGAYVFAGRGQSAYSASKAALNMMTCHLADEFADIGVRVNALAPDSFPQCLSTESVCDAIARIDADAITGKLIVLDGDGETVIST